MAILKMINVKEAGRKKFRTTLEYISNPKKTGKEMVKIVESAERFQKRTWVNRCLYGKEDCKRQYKQMIVSLAACWDQDPEHRRVQEEALEAVKKEYELYFSKMGYVTCAYIHCNTQHPHFHLMLETLNVITGKQFLQSPSDLTLLKNFGSAALRKAGFNEEILTSDIYEISEEDFWQSEEQEAFDNDADNNAEYKETEKDEWNNGTDGTKNREENFQSAMYNKAEIKKQNLEREEMGYAPRKAKRVEPAVQKEMCHVVISTNKEMCHVVEIPFGQRLNSTVPEQREMCRTVFQRQQGINTDNITGKTMCVIVK